MYRSRKAGKAELQKKAVSTKNQLNPIINRLVQKRHQLMQQIHAQKINNNIKTKKFEHVHKLYAIPFDKLQEDYSKNKAAPGKLIENLKSKIKGDIDLNNSIFITENELVNLLKSKKGFKNLKYFVLGGVDADQFMIVINQILKHLNYDEENVMYILSEIKVILWALIYDDLSMVQIKQKFDHLHNLIKRKFFPDYLIERLSNKEHRKIIANVLKEEVDRLKVDLEIYYKSINSKKNKQTKPNIQTNEHNNNKLELPVEEDSKLEPNTVNEEPNTVNEEPKRPIHRTNKPYTRVVKSTQKGGIRRILPNK